MGTHPIFESDFDCLTGNESASLNRRGSYNVIEKIPAPTGNKHGLYFALRIQQEREKELSALMRERSIVNFDDIVQYCTTRLRDTRKTEPYEWNLHSLLRTLDRNPIQSDIGNLFALFHRFDQNVFVFVSRIKSKAYQGYGILHVIRDGNLIKRKVEWKRVRDIQLTDVKHLQQKIKTPIGEVEMKEIGALTDGQPIEEQNAIELKKKFDQPRSIPPIMHYPDVSPNSTSRPLQPQFAPLPSNLPSIPRYFETRSGGGYERTEMERFNRSASGFRVGPNNNDKKCLQCFSRIPVCNCRQFCI